MCELARSTNGDGSNKEYFHPMDVAAQVAQEAATAPAPHGWCVDCATQRISLFKSRSPVPCRFTLYAYATDAASTSPAAKVDADGGVGAGSKIMIEQVLYKVCTVRYPEQSTEKVTFEQEWACSFTSPFA